MLIDWISAHIREAEQGATHILPERERRTPRAGRWETLPCFLC